MRYRLTINLEKPNDSSERSPGGGGMAGIVLGQLGIGALVIEGESASQSLQVLVIRQDSAELVEASQLKGLGNYDTVAALKK